jgi:hypothetical protein
MEQAEMPATGPITSRKTGRFFVNRMIVGIDGVGLSGHSRPWDIPGSCRENDNEVRAVEGWTILIRSRAALAEATSVLPVNLSC